MILIISETPAIITGTHQYRVDTITALYTSDLSFNIYLWVVYQIHLTGQCENASLFFYMQAMFIFPMLWHCMFLGPCALVEKVGGANQLTTLTSAPNWTMRWLQTRIRNYLIDQHQLQNAPKCTGNMRQPSHYSHWSSAAWMVCSTHSLKQKPQRTVDSTHQSFQKQKQKITRLELSPSRSQLGPS